MPTTEDTSQIIVDRRPLLIVIFARMRRLLLLGSFFLIFLYLLEQEGPADLSLGGYKVLCLFFLCVSLWATNLIPLSITSLFAIAAIPMLGIMDASQVYSFFGNKAVFFILGVFILSAAMIASGLSSRLSMWVLENWGSSPSNLVGAIYLFAGVSSCFMSEHAVAAMMFPLVMEIVTAMNLNRNDSVFGKSLFFALAWGCIIGGATTVLGGGRVPLAVEILEKATHGESSIGVLQYSQLSFPLIILLFVAGWVVLKTMFPPDVESVEAARKILKQKSMNMGIVTFQEKGVASVMMVTLFFWFVYGETFGIANIALISIVVLFIFNFVNWKMVEPHVNWAIILLYGGAICLGQVMAESGAALWLARNIFEETIHSAGIFLVAVGVLSMLLTSFMSNSAVIAVLLPPALSMCQTYEISPAVAAMSVILPSNFAFMLPIATPASALAYSSRFLSIGEMIRSGFVLSIFGILSYLFLLFIYWPLVGFQ
ncbi:MAG: DASS family sodium-coupled anion symporter [Nitrospinota bacterium]|nr:DASS family sodium-coupled anion symporter [Nitrospinota bacterium]